MKVVFFCQRSVVFILGFNALKFITSNADKSDQFLNSLLQFTSLFASGFNEFFLISFKSRIEAISLSSQFLEFFEGLGLSQKSKPPAKPEV